MTKKDLAICWFRQDLRLSDHPALAHALTHHPQVLCVYVDASSPDKPSAVDVWRYAAIDDLATQLHGRLCYQTGDAFTTLLTLVKQYQASAVYWNRAYDPPSVERDQTIKASLKAMGITVRSFVGNVLFEPWQILKKDHTPYRVFTPFYKACLTHGLPTPHIMPQWSCTQLYPVHFDASCLPRPTQNWSQQISAGWSVSRQGALDTLQRLVQHLAHYVVDRDCPAKPAVSRLSPYLHSGQISPREVWMHVSHQVGADAFIRQLIWREFAHSVLYHWPHTQHHPLDERFRDVNWQMDVAMLKAWQLGQTGIPIVDAGMRQLWQTGYMHNRVRLLTASYLCKHLLQDWRHGAQWFMHTLFDADLANNTMGWQWVAGCGVDAAPYFRIFNPVAQGEKFDPRGDYVRRWVPELQTMDNQWIHCPWLATTSVDYPQPLVDLAEGRKRALALWDQIKRIPSSL